MIRNALSIRLAAVLPRLCALPPRPVSPRCFLLLLPRLPPPPPEPSLLLPLQPRDANDIYAELFSSDASAAASSLRGAFSFRKATPVENALPCSLEDLYKGVKKKMKISRNICDAFEGDFGRLGHGDHSDMLIPRPIKALQGLMLQQVACGDSHCLAVTMDSHVLSVASISVRQLRSMLIGFQIKSNMLDYINLPMGPVPDRTINLPASCAPKQVNLNVPTIIDAFSVDGSSEQQIESSKPYASSDA
ncbi:hypothetical protein Fmac_022140 [Flemingia macrophylla]|uniref:Uncharacterized protein n=1 Tax=Flemingia macrophylla TaxID=520843 RepID=A0ABD1LZH1_9FABA